MNDIFSIAFIVFFFFFTEIHFVVCTHNGRMVFKEIIRLTDIIIIIIGRSAVIAKKLQNLRQNVAMSSVLYSTFIGLLGDKRKRSKTTYDGRVLR